jgi:Peptidase A4 family
MSSISTRLVALVIVTMALLTSAAVPAGAAIFATKTPKSAAAGYIATPTAAVTTASATVTLPTFHCKSKADLLSADVGVFDPSDGSVSLVTIALACSKTKVPSFIVLFDADGTDSAPDVTVTAGDAVTMSISCSATTGTTVSVDDTTTSATANASSTTPESCGEAFVGDEGFPKASGKSAEPLPTFGAIDYTNVMVNGAPLGSSTTVNGNYYEGKKAVIDTGALTAGGTAFTTTQES